MDIPSHRIVNGIEVPLTQAETDELIAEWQTATLSPQAVFDEKVMNGFDTGHGWFLPLDDSSRRSLGELRSQIVDGLQLGAWTAESDCPVAIRAVDGSLHTMTIGQVRLLIFMAGNYYAGLVSELRIKNGG